MNGPTWGTKMVQKTEDEVCADLRRLAAMEALLVLLLIATVKDPGTNVELAVYGVVVAVGAYINYRLAAAFYRHVWRNDEH